MSFRRDDDPEELSSFEQHRLWKERRTVYPATRGSAGWEPLPEPSPSYDPPVPHRAVIEPGFHIVRRAGTRDQIKRRLFPGYNLTADVDTMFDRLNPHLNDYVLPGEMVVLADPGETLCTADEQFLMEEAARIHTTLQQLQPEQRQFMVDYWQPLQDIAVLGEQSAGDASTLSGGSTAVGALSAAGSRLMSDSAQTLQQIDQLYQQALDPAHPMTRERFHAERARLFQRLSISMNSWVNAPLRLPRHPELKSRIRVAAKQQLHGVVDARRGGPFGLPTISETIAKVTLVDKLFSLGAFVGVGMDVVATQSSVNQACRDGRELECRRAQFVEYGGLGGRVFGSAAGAALGAARTQPESRICLAVSPVPHGKVACSLIGAGGGAVAGEKVVGEAGERVGEGLFQRIYGWAATAEEADYAVSD